MKGINHVSHPFFIAGLTLSVLALTPTAAAQQAVCDTRVHVLGQLAKKYGEQPVAIGVTNKGGLVEVLTTSDGNTWTIIVSMPNGLSCLVAAGQGWRTQDYEPMEPGA